ncbi:hypothetical protein N752_13225 [Desulforamulus aquiferis]|nr:hypothetical protein N752_13225 [Desulforamulus aquiferis]
MREHGFTIIETILVLCIFIFLLTTTLAPWPGHLHKHQLEG